MFLDESSNGAVFTEDTITNIYKTLNEANEEYARLAIKMCKYEHQAILTEDTALLEEAKESFGEKVKKLIESIWRSIVDAIAKFKNWIRQVIVNVGGKNADKAISDYLIEKIKDKGSVLISGVEKDLVKEIIDKKVDLVTVYTHEMDNLNKGSTTMGTYLYQAGSGHDSEKLGTLAVTPQLLNKLKEAAKQIPKDFEEIKTVESDARKKYKDSLAAEDKKPIEKAAKATAAAFKVTRKKISFILKVVSLTKKSLRASDSLNKAGKKINTALDND